VGLGSNLDERERHLRDALAALARLAGVAVAAVSPVYETEPQDQPDQPWFLNQVAHLRVGPDVGPEALLRAMLCIESGLGRERDAQAGRFGPRRIDLDLLLFDSVECTTPLLTLPHPRMRQRAFVLVPLADIAPGLVFPDGVGLAEAIAKLPFRVHNNCILQHTPPQG